MLIYDILLGDRVFWINFSNSGSLYSRILGSFAILRVNKQIRHETKSALKVRTLRVNKSNIEDVKLFSRIPTIISSWTPTIETVVIGYHTSVFKSFVGRHGRVQQDPLLTGLREVVVHLPKLDALTITCHNLPEDPRDGQFEQNVSEFSKSLSAFLPMFNQIQTITNKRWTWDDRGRPDREVDVEVKLSKARLDVQHHIQSTPQDVVCDTKQIC